jgi:hypothetical protein
MQLDKPKSIVVESEQAKLVPLIDAVDTRRKQQYSESREYWIVQNTYVSAYIRHIEEQQIKQVDAHVIGI